MYSEYDIAKIIANSIKGECEQYALEKMDKNDLILMTDAVGDINKNPVIFIKEDKEFYTYKRSCYDKFSKHYSYRFSEILNNILKQKKKSRDK